jgi:hypothetical protein
MSNGDVSAIAQGLLAPHAATRIIASSAGCQGGAPDKGEPNPMKMQVRDVVSHLGRDYLVEGVVTYRVNGKQFQLVRAVDGKDAGQDVLWVEPTRGDSDDRVLVLKEIQDLEMAVPPPESIQYGDFTYLQRLTGTATVEISGAVPERSPGRAQLWRYRAAGDLFLHIESGLGGVWTAAGESVHRGMIEILPGK